MYGEFLIESAPIMNNDQLLSLGQKFIDVSKQWDLIADDMWQLFQTGDAELLKKMSSVTKIYEIEKGLYNALGSCMF